MLAILGLFYLQIGLVFLYVLYRESWLNFKIRRLSSMTASNSLCSVACFSLRVSNYSYIILNLFYHYLAYFLSLLFWYLFYPLLLIIGLSSSKIMSISYWFLLVFISSFSCSIVYSSSWKRGFIKSKILLMEVL